MSNEQSLRRLRVEREFVPFITSGSRAGGEGRGAGVRTTPLTTRFRGPSVQLGVPSVQFKS